MIGTHGQAVVRHIASVEAFAARICPHCRSITVSLNKLASCKCGYVDQREAKLYGFLA